MTSINPRPFELVWAAIETYMQEQPAPTSKQQYQTVIADIVSALMDAAVRINIRMGLDADEHAAIAKLHYEQLVEQLRDEFARTAN